MTDRTYENLPTLIGELKRSAIDAYMKSQGWHIDEGVKYHLGDNYVTRPGADGQGGGDWSWSGFWDIGNEGQDAKWRGAFDTVRSNIDATLEKWLDLPDTAALLADDIEQMRQANRLLSFSPSGGTGGGNIPGYLTGVNENLDAMSGTTIATFKAEFLLQLEKAIGGHHGITVILGGALAATNEIWIRARKTVADIVGETQKALDAYANGGGISWEVVLQVAGYAVEGVGLFATGGASTALKGAGQGLKILTDTTTKKGEKASTPSLDYEGLMKGLGTALDDLSKAIKAEEDALAQNLTTNVGQVRADQGSYDLKRPAILDISDDSQANIIIINRPLVDEITRTYLPLIADDLDSARSQAYLATYEAYRDGSIGRGYNGISSEFSDLQWILIDLIRDLAWETRNGAKTLELAIEDIGRADTDVEDALEKHHREVKQGSGATPWD